MKAFLSVTFIFLGSLAIQGQITLSNEEYREKVLQYSYTLKKADNGVEAANSRFKAAQSDRLPSIGAAGNLNYQFNPASIEFGTGSIDVNNENYNADLTLALPLYAGGGLKAVSEGAFLEYEIATLQKALSEDQVIYQADITYWNTVAFADLLEITREYMNIVNEQYQLIKDKFEVGAVSQNELLMIESRKKEVEILLINTRRSYTKAQQSMNLLMGVDPNAETVPVDSISTPTPAPEEMFLDSILLLRPDFQITEKTIELRKNAIKQAVSQYNPQLNVGLSETWGTSMLNTNGDTRFGTLAYAQLNIPIFQWFERRHVKNQYSSLVNAAENEKQEIIDLTKIELQNSLVDYMESINQINISDQSLKIADESLDLNIFSYEKGRATLLEVLQVQLSWIQAYTDNIRAHLNNKVAWANYLIATGQL